METKRKKRLLNAVMVILILVIAACGVLAAEQYPWLVRYWDGKLDHKWTHQRCSQH
ncbi:MAG: hypothetical protein ACLTSZ_19165 [Lachnospiraceae bacterium]